MPEAAKKHPKKKNIFLLRIKYLILFKRGFINTRDNNKKLINIGQIDPLLLLLI